MLIRDLSFDNELASAYKSESQRIRILTEDWVAWHGFCPNCGRRIEQYSNNAPVADFYCPSCGEDFELKSKRDIFGTKIVDGAYNTMIKRISSQKNPNFFFLNYADNTVENFLVIPKHFFVDDIIEQRKPLATTARRAGWVGCNILINKIPNNGKVFYVRDSIAIPQKHIITEYNKTKFLQTNTSARGWLLDIMNVIEKFGKIQFSLQDVYAKESVLQDKHPDNNNVRAKIRQQLQILRDKGYLEFLGEGEYKVT